MNDKKNTAKPYTVKITIPVEDTAYLYIGAKSIEEAKEAAQQMLEANSAMYPNAQIVDVSEYQAKPEIEASETVSLN